MALKFPSGLTQAERTAAIEKVRRLSQAKTIYQPQVTRNKTLTRRYRRKNKVLSELDVDHIVDLHQLKKLPPGTRINKFTITD